MRLFRNTLSSTVALRLERSMFVAWVGAISVALAAGCSAGRAGDDEVGAVRALTGAHTRVVWVQGDGTDPAAEGDGLILVGFDTDDGRGERTILGERRSYVKPLLTPRGDRIVFTSRTAPGTSDIFIVNWDGTGVRRLADGFALATWEDPVDAREWVYASSADFARVTRFPIDAPHAGELVWNKTTISPDTFQVSADGRHAGGLFPWPLAGIAQLPNGSLRRLGDGCWTALAAPRGLLVWYFDGAHRNLTLVDVRSENRWVVNISQLPGFDGAEVFHPRWANHPRFLVISGPYNQGGDNQVSSGGAQTEVYLGRFRADYSSVEAWARVSENAGGDSYPDIWIDSRGPHAFRPDGPIGPPKSAEPDRAPEPAGARRLVLEVRLVRSAPVPTPRSILPYRHALLVREYEVLGVLQGAYAKRSIRIAQWVIRDGRVLGTAHRAAGETSTLTVEPYDAHGELEGERLISDGPLTDVPLYYDVERSAVEQQGGV